MKNLRFWLMAEVVLCGWLSFAPAQAESSDAVEKFLASLPDRPTLMEGESAIAADLPGGFAPPTGTRSLKMIGEGAVSPKPDKTISEDWLRELSVLSTATTLNFPASSQTPVAQMMPPPRPVPPPPASVQQPLFPNPEIIIQQNNLPAQPSGAPNPTILNPQVPVAPLRSRADPPPVGDLAISNINAS
ncbi:MAG: Type pilus biosis protein PilQ, partial [Cyanobacteriota bacterium]